METIRVPLDVDGGERVLYEDILGRIMRRLGLWLSSTEHHNRLVNTFQQLCELCFLPWNYVDTSGGGGCTGLLSPVDAGRVETLFRLRASRRDCSMHGCTNVVDIMYACGHPFCFDCVSTWADVKGEDAIERTGTDDDCVTTCALCREVIARAQISGLSKKLHVVLTHVTDLLRVVDDNFKIVIHSHSQLALQLLYHAVKGLGFDSVFHGYEDNQGNLESFTNFLQSPTRLIFLPLKTVDEVTYFLPPGSRLILPHPLSINMDTHLRNHLKIEGNDDTPIPTVVFVSDETFEENVGEIEGSVIDNHFNGTVFTDEIDVLRLIEDAVDALQDIDD